MADRLQRVRVFAYLAVLSGATRPLEASGALLIDAALIKVKVGEPVQAIKRESARRHVQIVEHGMNGALRNSGSNSLPGNLIGNDRVSHADHCPTTPRKPETAPVLKRPSRSLLELGVSVQAAESHQSWRGRMSMSNEKHIPRTWHDAEVETEEFQALLKKYPTYQEAVDAWVRGERPDPSEGGGSANPM